VSIIGVSELLAYPAYPFESCSDLLKGTIAVCKVEYLKRIELERNDDERITLADVSRI
jgi:hypothetical protein